MEWLSDNWVFLLVAIAFVAMHAFGHGGHGGHSGHGRRDGDDEGTGADTSSRRNGHRH